VWSWALFERPQVDRPLSTFPAFDGTGKFITAFTRALYFPLSWARSIQSLSLHPESPIFILIFSTHLPIVLPIGLFHSGCPTSNVHVLILIRATYPAHGIVLNLMTLITLREKYTSRSFSLCSFSPPSQFIPILFKYSPQTPSAYALPLMWETKFHTHTKPQTKLESFLRNSDRHLWVNCLENVEDSASHSPIDFQGLLLGLMYFFFNLHLWECDAIFDGGKTFLLSSEYYRLYRWE
jgi:hypothetical protein